MSSWLPARPSWLQAKRRIDPPTHPIMYNDKIYVLLKLANIKKIFLLTISKKHKYRHKAFWCLLNPLEFKAYWKLKLAAYVTVHILYCTAIDYNHHLARLKIFSLLQIVSRNKEGTRYYLQEVMFRFYNKVPCFERCELQFILHWTLDYEAQ